VFGCSGAKVEVEVFVGTSGRYESMFNKEGGIFRAMSKKQLLLTIFLIKLLQKESLPYVPNYNGSMRYKVEGLQIVGALEMEGQIQSRTKLRPR
jgi:hypothetical protein